MDPNTMKFASGSPLLGGTDALTQAMQSRGVDASVLNQVGGASPIAQPMPQPPTGTMSQPMPQGQNMTPQDPTAAPMPQSEQMPVTPESELIIKALSERLKHFSDIEKSTVEAQQPQPPMI